VQDAFQDVSPAYSVLVLTANSLCAVRDPFGMRPLSVGRVGTAVLVSSETCALDLVGATDVRDVKPGELLTAEGGQLRSARVTTARPLPAQCIFELVYFARPDSVVFGHNVAKFRVQLGARLALEAPAAADVVIPVPDSAVYSGLGYAHRSGLEVSMALCRRDVVKRTFIAPTPEMRAAAVVMKLAPIPRLVKGRRAVLVDDSLVRGNTCLHLVRMLRTAGAREVHVRISSPPVIASCHFGVDTPDANDLFAHGRSMSQMCEALGADSLEFLSQDGLLSSLRAGDGFCAGCFSGVYPIEVTNAHALPLTPAR
jgi:amidophosphoribosyltransferase